MDGDLDGADRLWQPPAHYAQGHAAAHELFSSLEDAKAAVERLWPPERPGLQAFWHLALDAQAQAAKINSTLKSFTLVRVGPVTTRSPKALK